MFEKIAASLLMLATFGTGIICGYKFNQSQVVKLRDAVAETKRMGEQAKKDADAENARLTKLKKDTDRDYQTRITTLAADNKRLLNNRSRSGYVPKAPASSERPDIACFNRAQLEQTLRQFDAGVSELFAEGDSNAVALSSAQLWASGIQSYTSSGNLDKSHP